MITFKVESLHELVVSLNLVENGVAANITTTKKKEPYQFSQPREFLRFSKWKKSAVYCCLEVKKCFPILTRTQCNKNHNCLNQWQLFYRFRYLFIINNMFGYSLRMFVNTHTQIHLTCRISTTELSNLHSPTASLHPLEHEQLLEETSGHCSQPSNAILRDFNSSFCTWWT